MQYPAMKSSAQYRVEVPQLAGGVNLSDLPTQVEDNQLTDVRNMWWHQGVLRTRPGLKEIGGESASIAVLNKSRISEREEIVFRAVDRTTVQIDSFSTDGSRPLGEITISPMLQYRSALGVRVDEDEPYLIFAADGQIFYAKNDNTLQEAEPYVPLVTVERRNEDGSVSKVKFEDYNMLTPQFKCSFSTDGVRAIYSIPKSGGITSIVSVTINLGENDPVTLYDSNNGGGWTKIAAEKAGEKAQETYPGKQTLEVSYGASNDGSKIVLYVREEDAEAISRWYPPEVTSNNLIITAETNSSQSRKTICQMTKAVWFGGTRSGLDGGTRLFVTGNPEKPNLVHWSDVNKPLYFPENNYFCVGGADQRVTAFGKQGDLLVIFKEREIYCSQYVAGSTITADDLISGKVTDIAALTAQFPLTPLHPTIGCDCPDTIRLVNNRLVWATSDAHVYMLPSVNQYSERNVRDITALIRRDLEKHTTDELKATVAAEYKGHYMMILPDGTAYLLDVGNSAFQSFAYYASEKKANRALPWYIWKLGKEGERFLAAVSTGDELRLLANDDTDREYIFDGDTDEGEPIACSFTTKLFDFGRGDRRKAVCEMYLRVGGVADSCVHLSYLVDSEMYEDIYRIEPTEDGELYDAGYIRSYRITPNVNGARLFGLRFDSDGAMAVEGIAFNYSIQGVIR